MNEFYSDMSQFLKERDEVLLSMDMDRIIAYCEKYGISIPASERVFLAGIHNARIGILDFPKEEKVKSVAWLIQNGFEVPEYLDYDISHKGCEIVFGKEE
jgi:hypothetical protein